MLAVLLRDALPPVGEISAWGERLVGGALIALGCWSLSHAARLRRASHAHGGTRHDHVHVQRGPQWMRRLGHGHASFAVGLLHGVAGSSHFFGVLPALALPTPAASFGYIAAFGLGTVVAMTGVCRRRRPRRHHRRTHPAPRPHVRHRRGGDSRRVRLDRRNGILRGGQV